MGTRAKTAALARRIGLTAGTVVLAATLAPASRAQASGSAGQVADAAPAWTEADREAVAHVLGNAAGLQTLTLDLSDPLNAHFLARHYDIGGMTLDRYPGLHGLIEEHRTVHAESGVAMPSEVEVSDDLLYSDLATVMLALYPTSATETYTGAAAASMEAPADDPSRTLQISYSSLCFYDSNNAPIGTCATSSSFGSGQYFPVNHSVTTADQAFTAAFTATYYDATNKRYISQISTLGLDTIDYPESQTISNPVIVHSQNNSLLTALVCTARSVNANANPGVCDYGNYSTTGVLVDMGGSVTYKAAQTPRTDASGHLVGTGSVSLLNTVQGGSCRLAPSISGTNFFSQPQVTYNASTKTLAWNFNDLDFGSASSLICGGDGTNIQFALTLQVENAASADTMLVASQLSQTGTVTPHFIGPNAGALATPMLRLVAGCLHPDTRVTLADGSLRPVAEFDGEGEMVASIGGVETYVIGTVNGHEATLFRIQTTDGLSVDASAMHPFVMADGSWRAAADLRAGDRVVAASGIVIVSSVSQIAYDGPVHNLILGRTAAALHPETESFYANGFLVGGHDAQQQLAAAKLADPRRVTTMLPPGFEIDYASHLEDHRQN